MTPIAAPTGIDDALLGNWPLPAVAPDGDKESRGRVIVVAGSRELPGAAVLAATAALRAGAGKLVVATPQSAWPIVAAALPEARVIALPETPGGGPAPQALDLLHACAGDDAALLVGPGMMDTEATVAFTRALLLLFGGGRTVLDALALDTVRAQRRFARPVLLTPHAGEMAHLTANGKEEVVEEAAASAASQAARWNAVVALKGAETWIAHPDGRRWRHACEEPGLATSGSGDVLAGLVAGLLARGCSLEQAAAWGVALHARAGRALAARHGRVGYLARELAEEIPALLAAVL